MIQSLWTLTFDPAGTPLVLLSAGEAIEDELRFNVQKGLEVVELESSAAPFLRPRGNVAHTLEFDRRIVATTDAAARAALLDWQVTFAALGRKPLKCQFTGDDDYWTFSNSFITAARTWRKVVDKSPAYILSVSITATGLTKTVVP